MMKGVSPLIAAVLLIAFTMAIAGVIATWGTTFVRQQTVRASTEAECLGALDISSLKFDGGTVSFKIRNVAAINMTNLRATLEYSDASKNRDYLLKQHGVDDPLGPADTKFASINTILDDPALMGYWKFDNSTFDSSENGNDGTAYGGVDCSPDVTGKFGSACNFDNVDGHINATSAMFDFGKNDKFTVEAWFKANDVSEAGTIARKGDATNFGYRLRIVQGGLEFIIFDTTPSGHVEGVSSSEGSIKQGQLHHGAGVYNKTHIAVYLDGKKMGEKALDSSPDIRQSAGTPLSIGGGAVSAAFFDGVIDEAFVWKRELSSTEIQDHASGIYSKTKPLSIEVFSETCPRQAQRLNFE